MSSINTAALLVAELQAAKIAEAKAIERRIDAEMALIAELGQPKAEGATSYKIPGYRITVTGVVNRTVDPVMLAQVKAVMPPGLFDQAIRYKPDIILTGLRYLQNNEPEAYGLLAQAITAKPGKTQVKVEPIATATDEE